MGFDVLVIINGSDLGERILKLTWHVAQELFRKYGIEVFVIPHFVRGREVSIVINGIEYIVKRELSKEEIMDMILTAIPVPSEEYEVTVLGVWGSSGGGEVGTASAI